jgi:hypothetical protein
VWERHECTVQATCQSVASRSNHDLMLQGKIRNISVGGVGLVVERRFEPGTGIFIECQTNDNRTVGPYMARVVHATSRPDGTWLLGCAFVSKLGDEEIRDLLQTADQNLQPAPKQVVELERVTARLVDESYPAGMRKPASDTLLLANVTLAGERPDAATVCVMARRLSLTGIWPPPNGAGVQLSVLTKAGERFSVQIRVLESFQHDGRWTLRYAFLGEPPALALRAFGHDDT